MIINDDGSLTTIEDAAMISVGSNFVFEPFGKLFQFFSAGSSDSRLTIKSSLTQTESFGITQKSTFTNEYTSGSEVGGEVSGSIEAGLKKGVDFKGNISASGKSKIEQKIGQAVERSLSVQVSAAKTYSEDYELTIKAGKYTVLITTWQRKFIPGTVTIGSQSYIYEATLGYLASRQIFEYDSLSDFPPEFLVEYHKQNGTKIALKLFWHPERGDNFTTATSQGEQDALGAGYVYVRDEGYVFKALQPGTVPLKLFWHLGREDNFTTATSQGEQDALGAGYVYVRDEGYVFTSQKAGLVPLKLFWSPELGDNFTTSTAKGQQDASAAGYIYVRDDCYI